jgi:hypothetical protein
MPEEKVEEVKAEVQRLLDTGFIREVTYPQWLANVVVVCKKNGKWRMCTDFTNFNKNYPKDDFPLARIDRIVDSTIGCEMMALLDCFSDSHQIWHCKQDEENMSFIIPFVTYCCLRMFEGLRNAGPTFLRNDEGLTKRPTQ